MSIPSLPLVLAFALSALGLSAGAQVASSPPMPSTAYPQVESIVADRSVPRRQRIVPLLAIRAEALRSGDSALAASAQVALADEYYAQSRHGAFHAAIDSAYALLPSRPHPEAAFRVYAGKAHQALRRRFPELAMVWHRRLDSLATAAPQIPRACRLVNGILVEAAAKRGRHDEALAAAHAALACPESRPGSTDRLYVLEYLVGVHQDRRDFASVALWLDSLEAASATMPNAEEFLRFAARYRASLAFFDDDLDGALALLDAAERDYPTEGPVLDNLRHRGAFLGQAGRYRESIAVFRQLIDVSAELDVDPAYALYWTGICYRGLDDYPTAATFIGRAVDTSIARKSYRAAANYAHALYQTYLWRDRHREALGAYTTHVRYRDSVETIRTRVNEEVLVAQEALQRRTQEARLAEVSAAGTRRNNRLLAALLVSLAAATAALAFAYRQRRRAQAATLREREATLAAETARAALLDDALRDKTAEVGAQALTLTQKSNLLQNLGHELDAARRAAKRGELDATQLARLQRTAVNDATAEDEWSTYLASVTDLQSGLFDALRARHPDLTPKDLRLVALLRLGLTSKETAATLAISEAGVKKARYRLRKRLGLGSGQSIPDYLRLLGVDDERSETIPTAPPKP